MMRARKAIERTTRVGIEMRVEGRGKQELDMKRSRGCWHMHSDEVSAALYKKAENAHFKTPLCPSSIEYLYETPIRSIAIESDPTPYTPFTLQSFHVGGGARCAVHEAKVRRKKVLSSHADINISVNLSLLERPAGTLYRVGPWLFSRRR